MKPLLEKILGEAITKVASQHDNVMSRLLRIDTRAAPWPTLTSRKGRQGTQFRGQVSNWYQEGPQKQRKKLNGEEFAISAERMKLVGRNYPHGTA
jgi:hypothetical protein